MTRTNPGVDLASLARPAPPVAAPRRRWRALALPLLLLVGFGAVLASSLGDWLSGALEVEIVRPVPAAGGAAAPAREGAVAVQAAGWVEPDPFPIRVSARTSGIVSEVLVQESDAVEEGQPVARLVAEDAELARRDAEGRLAEAEAELARREAESAAARESFEAALEPTERAAAAEAERDGRAAEAERREQAALAARAALSAAESELEVQRYLAQSGAAGPRAVELAEAALATSRAEAEGIAAEAELARAMVRGAEAALVRARRELELRTEDELRVAAAGADERVARARRDQARVALETAELALERTTVRAPAAGVVLQRLVAPGAELGPESSAVVTLYDPRSVRVRVDVPQGEIAKLAVGQAVRVEADSRPGRPYSGEVTRLVRQADINKVTLQAHVRISDGDELLRPEMLVQARFLGGAPSDAPAAGGAPASGALLIPAALVRDGSVWVLDALGKRAERRAIRAGEARGSDVEVLEGLNLSDKLIASRLDELEPGTRVEAREALR